MKNILSYKDKIFTGKEIKEWIIYHTTHQTSLTKIAEQLEKYLNINDNQLYRLYKGTYQSSANKYLIKKEKSP